MDLIFKDLDSKDRELTHGLTMGMRSTMAPGLKLYQLIEAAVSALVGFFDGIADLDDPLVILYEWVRARLTETCTEAIYGLGKSFEYDTEGEGVFW